MSGYTLFLDLAKDVQPPDAEMLGTFALVFAGTGAIVINDVSCGTVSHVGIALAFGLIVSTGLTK